MGIAEASGDGVSNRSELLKFLEENGITIHQAIQLLEQEEHAFLSNKDRKEKAVLKDYEKR
jgi:hypothetical protein